MIERPFHSWLPMPSTIPSSLPNHHSTSLVRELVTALPYPTLPKRSSIPRFTVTGSSSSSAYVAHSVAGVSVRTQLSGWDWVWLQAASEADYSYRNPSVQVQSRPSGVGRRPGDRERRASHTRRRRRSSSWARGAVRTTRTAVWGGGGGGVAVATEPYRRLYPPHLPPTSPSPLWTGCRSAAAGGGKSTTAASLWHHVASSRPPTRHRPAADDRATAVPVISFFFIIIKTSQILTKRKNLISRPHGQAYRVLTPLPGLLISKNKKYSPAAPYQGCPPARPRTNGVRHEDVVEWNGIQRSGGVVRASRRRPALRPVLAAAHACVRSRCIHRPYSHREHRLRSTAIAAFCTHAGSCI
jgi:hypothetical protein